MVENQVKDEGINVESAISSVIVFLDGARVTRKNVGEITIKKGINVLKLEGISKYLDRDSVRVKGSGKGVKATLVDVEVNYVYKETTGHEKLDRLQEELKKLNKELATVRKEQDHHSWVRDNFSNILDSFSEQFPKFFAAGETDLQNLKSMQSYSDEILSNSQKKLNELDENAEKLNSEIAKVQKEINKFGGEAIKVEEYYDVIVSIEADGTGTFDLSITYQITGASWKPSYDVLITENDTTINYRAEIVNTTLEDWEDVDLGVSTATFKPVRIIEPDPWYIQQRTYDYYEGYDKGDFAGAPMEAEEKAKASPVDMNRLLEKKEEMAPPTPPVEMKIEQAAFSEDSFGVQHYDIPKKMTIKADGNPHPVMLQEIDVTSTRLFYWNSQDQVLVAQEKIKNGDSVLLPGKCKCYVDGDFVGQTSIKVISPGEEFKLGARSSFEMKVEKKLTKREVGKKGIMKGKLTNEYGYEIKINNYRKKESELTLIDRIPHSRSADIIIEPDEKHLNEFFDPVPEKFQLGIATYELKLKPEQEFKIKYGYKASYPKDITVDPPLP